MMEVKVSAFIPPDASPGELLETIRSVVRGEKGFPSPRRGDTGEQRSQRTQRSRHPRNTFHGRLSSRDREMISMLTTGLGRSQIARGLDITPSTLDRLGFNILKTLCTPEGSTKLEMKGRSRRRG
jgi:DNA-binding NarL/FixJ family response regulator